MSKPDTTSELPQFPPLPTGMIESDYAGNENWNDRRWAWEFLRRNSEFQIWCQMPETNKISRKARNEISRNEYGLIEYKYCMEPYEGPGIKRPKFSTSNIQSWSFITEKQINKREDKIRLLSQPGTVLIRFNIGAIEKSTKALNRQLDSAKELLEKRQKQWEKTLAKPPIVRRIRSQNLLELLRILDIIKYNDEQLSPKSAMTRAELYKIIAQEPEDYKKVVGPKILDDQKAFQDKKEIAEWLTGLGVLELAASKKRSKALQKRI